jgi:hypothetical protein
LIHLYPPYFLEITKETAAFPSDDLSVAGEYFSRFSVTEFSFFSLLSASSPWFLLKEFIQSSLETQWLLTFIIVFKNIANFCNEENERAISLFFLEDTSKIFGGLLSTQRKGMR